MDESGSQRQTLYVNYVIRRRLGSRVIPRSCMKIVEGEDMALEVGEN